MNLGTVATASHHCENTDISSHGARAASSQNTEIGTREDERRRMRRKMRKGRRVHSKRSNCEQERSWQRSGKGGKARGKGDDGKQTDVAE